MTTEIVKMKFGIVIISSEIFFQHRIKLHQTTSLLTEFRGVTKRYEG